MLANYHTHTWRCNHASGTEREYVENALKMGIQIFGFSDHSPYVFPGDYYSSFRMKLDQLEDYVNSVLELQREFCGQIQIPLGLELEYYPGHLPNLLPVLKDYPFDYVIMGQHFVGDEINEHYSGHLTDDRKIFERYVNQVIDGMYTGLFTYVAHPDLIHYRGDDGFYRMHMARLCKAAKECGIPLEVNLLGVQDNRNYPNPMFWEMAATENCDVILGRDAHSPQQVLNTASEEAGLDIVRKFDLHLLETVDLRPIR